MVDYDDFRKASTPEEYEAKRIQEIIENILEETFQNPLDVEDYEALFDESEYEDTDTEYIEKVSKVLNYHSDVFESKIIDGEEYIGLTERMYTCVKKSGGPEKTAASIVENSENLNSDAVKKWIQTTEESIEAKKVKKG